MTDVRLHRSDKERFSLISPFSKYSVNGANLDWIAHTSTSPVGLDVSSITGVHTSILIYCANECL